MKKCSSVLALALLSAFTANTAVAQERTPRWFEVEVILFTHKTEESQLKEEFSKQVKPITYRRTRDLLTPFHFPDLTYIKYPSDICPADKLLPQPQFDLALHDDTANPDEHQAPQSQPSARDGDFDYQVIEQDAVAENESVQYDIAVTEQAPVLPSEPLPSIEELTAPIDTSLLNFMPAGNTRWPNYITGRPDCLQSPWLQVPLVEDNYNEFHYEMFPRVIVAGEMEHNPYVHLISPANFQLRDIYRSLRRTADIRPILHTAWRQPAGAEKYSRATRLYAGIDFSRRFDFQGNPLPDELLGAATVAKQDDMDVPLAPQPDTSVVDNIERLLALVDNGAKVDYRSATIDQSDDEQMAFNIKEVREIDGLFRIYIDPFNYLHIDAEFNVRKEVPAPQAISDNSVSALLEKVSDRGASGIGLNFEEDGQNTLLKNYHFKQTRRVISTQVHYFDHPFMGMIVQIRRYGW